MLHGFGGPGTRGEFQLYQYLLEGLWFNLKGEPPQNTRAHSKVKQVWQKRPAWLNIDLMTDLTKKEKKKKRNRETFPRHTRMEFGAQTEQ